MLEKFSFYVYECPVCCSQHHTRNDALNCCCKVKEGYSCPKCQVLHKTVEQADTCCAEANVTVEPLNYVHKQYPIIAMRWKGNTKALNYLLGQGAAQLLPGTGILLCGEAVVTKGDWIIRKANGVVETLSDEQFHEEYETE